MGAELVAWGDHGELLSAVAGWTRGHGPPGPGVVKVLITVNDHHGNGGIRHE